MSEQEEATQEGVAIPDDPGAAFAAILDVLEVDPSGEEGEPNGAEAQAPTAGDLAPTTPVEGAGAGAGEPAAPATGDVGSGELGGDAPAAATGFDAVELAPKWADVVAGLETKQRTALEDESRAEVREEFARYFEAIESAPRALVGLQVPSVVGEGMETIRDSADARDWQEAVKQQLVKEIRDRASRKADDVRPMMETLNNSVSLFRDNIDLIPGSKQFDKELADEFAALAEPYALRQDGKFVGYSIQVSPLVTQVRNRLQAQRAAKGAAPAEPTAQQQRAAEQARNAAGQFHAEAPAETPQAGIVSRAGSSSTDATEDFSTLFGALGLPDLKI